MTTFNSNNQHETDYQPYLNINGKTYISLYSNDESVFTKDLLIGEVLRNVPIDENTDDDFSSNYLEKGTEIYSVKENLDAYLVEDATNDQIRIYHTSEDMEKVEELVDAETNE
ncbi:hypothetical protein J2S05_000009 [Alkalicoccobacillus murimartini]|uniref:Uncharacterized protein n=2 Tax=Alkalicoccobacillus murimartini TaxID=171685 RepID=A0ABT9YBL6_9BACI|nr:hypothetical protein [Alkalicoccobacillus murimartini]